MIEPPVVRIPAPVLAPEPPRPGFPFVATLAPLAMAGVLFAVTGSPFMLLMGLLSPVVAAGTMLDGRRQRRRARRDEAARLVVELESLEARVDLAQRTELDRLAGFASFAPRWGGASDEILLIVGRGEAPSGVEIPPPLDARSDPPELAGLRRRAGTLPDAPVVRDLAGGAVIDGPGVLAAAAARGIVLRLAARLSPVETRIVAPRDEEWVRSLPHAVADGPDGSYLLVTDEREIGVGWRGAVAETAVPVDAARADAVTRATAEREARRLAEAARSAGLRPPGSALPELVRLGDLLGPAGTAAGLRAPVGRDADGVVALDLVADGPHALVAGTTGSGKSELLVAWVLAMAHGRGPDEVSFVLVDFKGGAAFAPLAVLPHVLGTLSDLDERLARRAIESLQAEVLRRERILAEAGVRGIADLAPGTLARLVVVVDEFAALVSDRSELHALFADLAARGRSLGIHLVLCTQRPAGVVRDAILANIAVRVALRVADRADSLGLLGDDAAARLPVSARGRAVLDDGSGGLRHVQLALADVADVDRIAAASRGAGTMRPWCDPLPPRIEHAELPPAAGIPFGLLDLPAEQRQPTAALEPRHGHLLVLGAPGSGTSTALASVAAGAGEAARWLPGDPVELWAVLDPGGFEPGTLLIADDLDLTLARCDPEYAAELADLVARMLREGPHRGIRVIASARRLSGPLAALGPQFGSRLLLRMPSREEHVLAGGDGARFDPRAVPGSGTWEGAVLQVAVPEPAPRREVPHTPPTAVGDGRELAVVSGRPREFAELAAARGARLRWLGAADDEVRDARLPAVLLGDPDAWQADWAELTRARRDLPMVFHACTTADVRAIARTRETPPPLHPGEVWLVEQGRVRRARLDGTPGGRAA